MVLGLIMMRISCLTPSLLLVLTLSVAVPAADRLNVLFIAVDDLRPNLGCYGATGLKTPNIDRLAAGGMLFRRAYCQIASCGPSRASLLTGRRPETTTVFDNHRRFRTALPDVVTLPEHFKNHGYQTRSFGKVFHGIFSSEINDDPPSWSVPAWRPRVVQYRTKVGIQILRQRSPRAFQDATQSVEDIQSKRRFKGLAVEAPDVEDSDLTDGRIADQAIEVMHEIKNEPFFLAVGFIKPHAPYVAPKKYFDLYGADDFPTPAVDEFPSGAPPQAHNDDSRELRGYVGIDNNGPIPANQARWVTHGYNACVSYVDAQIGRLVNELEELRLDRKTVIVLWGDHGYHLGHNGLWCKNTNFEAATRVPLIVSAPGARAKGQSTNALVELVDLYPTLAELCSLPVPSTLQGTSFAPLLDQPTLPWKKAAFSQVPRPISRPKQGWSLRAMGRSLRTDRYRFVEWTGAGLPRPRYELYDYSDSEPEKFNKAHQPSYRTVVEELRELLHAGWSAALP